MNPIPPPKHGNDPLGWREQFRRAMAHPKLADLGRESDADDEALRAAYQLASALGHCRLFGVDIGAADGTLPPEVAAAAARRWDLLLGEWTLRAARLDQVWSGSAEEFEALDASADLLGARMESWAVFLAIDEAYQDVIERDAAPRRRLKSLLDTALNALDRFDAALQETAAYLAPVAGTQLLGNWRALVSDQYRGTPPWWLDGELEKLFERIQKDAHGWLPRPRRRETIMKTAVQGAIPSVAKLLTATEGLRVSYDPPASRATDGVFDPVPAGLQPELAAYLTRRYSHGLFRHQRAAVQGVLKGKHTVVATRTSSGKSLIYSIPVLDRLLIEPDATALFLFPQKALANDQLQRLIEAADDIPSIARMRAAKPHLIARYDGATSEEDKPRIRSEAQVLLSNPDMLHYALLAWHERHWQRFFSRLRYVVADECHEYRGIFGTNVSYLFRRLRALCARYGSSPTFIATSATVQSPQEHMQRVTGLPFACVGPDEDGSRQGERKFWMVRPDEHPYDAGRKLTLALAESGLTVLTFCLSRAAAERMMARSGKDNKDPEPPFVRVYRAGLTRSEREEIEQGLRNRTVRAVFSTSALELGIDIGAIDVVVCVGLPTTMMSLWQRAGRAGRAGKQGAVVLIPGQTPIDTYYADHPEDLFARDHEPLILNLTNRPVMHMHYACAVKEAGGDEARLDTATLGPEIASVKKRRDAGELQEDPIFYVSDPHRSVRIRGAGDEAYKLMVDKEEIGEIDPFHLLREAPRNGIYYHGGQRYRVQDVRQKERVVRLTREYSPHFTTSNIGTSIRVRRPSAIRRHGRVVVAQAVLDVNDYLRSVTEKHLNGDVVRTYPGNGGMPNNWLPTEGTMLRLERPLWDEVTARLGDGAAKAALDTTARLFGSLFPTVTGPCDASDYSAAADFPKDSPPAVYLYDMVQYGVGLAVEACDRMGDLVSRSTELVRGCDCGSDEGCFRCVRNPQAEVAASKTATQTLLEMLKAELATPPVVPEPAADDAPAAPTKNCPKCHHPATPQAKFCSNCGHKMETP